VYIICVYCLHDALLHFKLLFLLGLKFLGYEIKIAKKNVKRRQREERREKFEIKLFLLLKFTKVCIFVVNTKQKENNIEIFQKNSFITIIIMIFDCKIKARK
jgi:hypothetical protein